ncbi:MAG: hypothetical protein ACPHP1_08270 [Miltoncostaeaceae bacterium]
MGAKTGYADAILRCLGLYPGQGAEHYLWCEPDAGVRLLLHALRDREIATKAAAIIASWASEDPRVLWERLKAEGPAVCPPVDPREVARFVYDYANRVFGDGGFAAAKNGSPGDRWPTHVRCSDDLAAAPTLPATIADDARKVDPREVARWSWMSQRSIFNGSEDEAYFVGPNPVSGGHTRYAPTSPAPAVLAAPTIPATITDDARAVDAREVARFLYGSAASYDPSRPWNPCAPSVWLQARLDALPAVDATITDDARPLEPPQLPPGVIAYIDPPYLNTTGYAHAFPRSEWLPVVRRWKAAGALVAVSEAEPIPDLIAEGWHAVEITGERKGQKRTFSKQQREFLTMSEPPRWRPAVQGSLFG